jgi:glucose-6-phosphate dehydrogenase assembly protein OpcA
VASGLDDAVWSERDTSPAAVEAALRELLAARYAEDSTAVPARVLNLVAVVDRQWRGEVQNRLERVGRYHASRTVLCAVEPGRTTIDARARIAVDPDPRPGEFATMHEHVVVDVGPQHVEHLDTIVDPLVVTDLPTMVWAPHGHGTGIDALLPLAQVVLIDSVDEPDLDDAVARALELSERVYVVDLAWLRSTPWRERVAGTFDPPAWRAQLRAISAVTIRHHPASAMAGLLFLGWLASRVGWEPTALTPSGASLVGRAHARRQDVTLTLEPAPEQSVRGLESITVATAHGFEMSLRRGEGGLHATRRAARQGEQSWVVMGASRGEAGILGEGIRQALLRDPTYGPALRCAAAMLP